MTMIRGINLNENHDNKHRSMRLLEAGRVRKRQRLGKVVVND